MTIATIGSRFQVVVPAAERRKLGLKPQQKVTVEVIQGAIVMRPVGASSPRGIGVALGDGGDAVAYVRELRAAGSAGRSRR